MVINTKKFRRKSMRKEDRCAWVRCRQEGTESGVQRGDGRVYWLCPKHHNKFFLRGDEFEARINKQLRYQGA